jgi:hypothetical protein
MEFDSFWMIMIGQALGFFSPVVNAIFGVLLALLGF